LILVIASSVNDIRWSSLIRSLLHSKHRMAVGCIPAAGQRSSRE
jgi:hypothetical protein